MDFFLIFAIIINISFIQRGFNLNNYNDFVMAIKKITKIDLSSYKEKQMKRRIESFIRRNGHDSYSSYFEQLKRSEQHLKEFLSYITINVSEFFRNPSQWQVLEKDILPDLISKKKTLRVWSSACSTGEEPYSLVMLFNKIGVTERVNIIASDIDKDVLEKAKHGVYSYKEIENISKDMIDKSFIKKDNSYIIKDSIKHKVTFKVLDLLEDSFPSECDLILCRNVMIYFTDKAKDKLYKKFYKALSDEGIFFVGSTEQIIMPQKYGFASCKNFFYKKI